MKTVRLSALLTPMFEAQQRELQGKEIRNVGKSQENLVESTFSKDAISEIRDTSPAASSRAPRRKGGQWTINYQAEMLC
jgi:hypothetical protein